MLPFIHYSDPSEGRTASVFRVTALYYGGYLINREETQEMCCYLQRTGLNYLHVHNNSIDTPVIGQRGATQKTPAADW
jgi:hypothetical protein